MVYINNINKKLNKISFKMFFKTQEVWKLMYHSNFQSKKNMYFIVTMSNSHKNWLSFVSKRESCFLSFNRSYFWRLTFPLFWKRFLCQEIKGKLNLYKKGTLKDTNKRHLYFYKTLQNFLSDIANLFHIHQLDLMYLSHFEVYFCSKFHLY